MHGLVLEANILLLAGSTRKLHLWCSDRTLSRIVIDSSRHITKSHAPPSHSLRSTESKNQVYTWKRHDSESERTQQPIWWERRAERPYNYTRQTCLRFCISFYYKREFLHTDTSFDVFCLRADINCKMTIAIRKSMPTNAHFEPERLCSLTYQKTL